MSTNKKRKSDSTFAAIETMSYEDVVAQLEQTKAELVETEAELVETKAELTETKAELTETKSKLLEAEAKVGSTEDDDISDGEEDFPMDTNDPWTAKYLELREYRIMNGDCNVPRNGSNPKLGVWVGNQRLHYNNLKNNKNRNKISEERIAILEGLGFSWGKKYPSPASWEERFQELKKYQKAMGNCNIQMNPTNPSPLAKWVSAQRSEYKRFRKGCDSLLTLEQIGQLKEIQFKWNGPRL